VWGKGRGIKIKRGKNRATKEEPGEDWSGFNEAGKRGEGGGLRKLIKRKKRGAGDIKRGKKEVTSRRDSW